MKHGGRTHITHSRLVTLNTCRRKAHLSYMVGLRADRDAPALRIGTAVHFGIELWHSGHGSVDDVCREVVESYAVEIAKARDPEAMHHEVAKVLALLRGYCWRWQNAPLEFVETELAFDLPLRNPKTGASSRLHRVAGKIDGIVRLEDGTFALHEIKTTSDAVDLGSDYWRRLRIDGQVSHYMIAAREMGFDINAVLYDVIRKPTIKPKAISKAARKQADEDGHYFNTPIDGPCPDRETSDLYVARVLDDIGENPDKYYTRGVVHRTDGELDEYRAELWQSHKLMLDPTLSRTRNTAACLSHYGRCPFFDLCTTGQCPEPGDAAPEGFVKLDSVHPELDTPEGVATP